MANPSYTQPFAPVGAAVQYEAPHGLLKLRGGHDQHDTTAFPELDQKGVSLAFLSLRVPHREITAHLVFLCRSP